MGGPGAERTPSCPPAGDTEEGPLASWVGHQGPSCFLGDQAQPWRHFQNRPLHLRLGLAPPLAACAETLISGSVVTKACPFTGDHRLAVMAVSGRKYSILLTRRELGDDVAILQVGTPSPMQAAHV